ncbi:DsbA family oxidoreductase [Stygiolobus sp. RP850M]|uniref:DsbA family oxidoreductase n=1 Tax=Stygiolobus sp. RP850M TaxID=3133137 RepID=UPI00307D5C0D
MIKLTFFHDVICPFCYMTSKRLKKVVNEFKGEVIVNHKAFAIISSLEDLKAIAPTEEDARQVFLNEFSILKRYIPDYDPEKVIGKGKIKYVWSIPPLIACKAAEFQKGDEGHWEFFDKAQDKFFLEGEDITDEKVLVSIAEEIGLDVNKFKEDLNAKRTKLAVIEDEEEAKAMGIRGVPAILVNDTWLIRGVQEENYYRAVIKDILEHGEPKEIKLKAYWEKD